MSQLLDDSESDDDVCPELWPDDDDEERLPFTLGRDDISELSVDDEPVVCRFTVLL